MGRFRPCIDFEQLLRLQDILDIRLFTGDMTWWQYEREFAALLLAAGYTYRDYQELVDRRWDHLHRLGPGRRAQA